MKMVLFCFKICQVTLVRSVIPFLTVSATWATFYNLLLDALCTVHCVCQQLTILPFWSSSWKYVSLIKIFHRVFLWLTLAIQSSSGCAFHCAAQCSFFDWPWLYRAHWAVHSTVQQSALSLIDPGCTELIGLCIPLCSRVLFLFLLLS